MSRTAILPIDEARLRPHLRRVQPRTEIPVVETEPAAAPSNWGVMADARELRGLPVVASGVAGVQPGGDPLGALLAKERRQQ